MASALSTRLRKSKRAQAGATFFDPALERPHPQMFYSISKVDGASLEAIRQAVEQN
jgi:hypothetical protein